MKIFAIVIDYWNNNSNKLNKIFNFDLTLVHVPCKIVQPMHYQHQHFEITPHPAFALTVVSRSQIPNCKNPFHAHIQTDEANLDQISSAFFFDFLGGQDGKRVGLKQGNVIVFPRSVRISYHASRRESDFEGSSGSIIKYTRGCFGTLIG